MQEDITDAIGAATRDNVSVYAINAGGGSQPGGLMFLRRLAAATGGMAFLDSGDTAGSLARIVQDNSSYYILGYHVPPGRSDGRFRTVKVQVHRPGLTVRARPGYYTPAAAAATTTAKLPATKASTELQAALRSPLPVNGLVFSASAAASQGNTPNVSVSLVVEIEPQGLAFSERRGSRNTDIELHVTATDPASKVPADSRHHLAELRLRPQMYDAVQAEGVRITRRLDLRPGRYRVQVGVRDKTSGLLGTQFMDLDVPDLVKPALAMSGIVLVSAAATRAPTIAADAALATILPGAPTARRAFPPNDTLAVYTEIYDNDLAKAHRFVVKTTVRDAGGAEAFSATSEYASQDVSAAARAKKRGAIRHLATVPVSALSSGHHILQIEATPLPGEGHTVMRQVPFTIGSSVDR